MPSEPSRCLEHPDLDPECRRQGEHAAGEQVQRGDERPEEHHEQQEVDDDRGEPDPHEVAGRAGDEPLGESGVAGQGNASRPCSPLASTRAGRRHAAHRRSRWPARPAGRCRTPRASGPRRRSGARTTPSGRVRVTPSAAGRTAGQLSGPEDAGDSGLCGDPRLEPDQRVELTSDARPSTSSVVGEVTPGANALPRRVRTRGGRIVRGERLGEADPQLDDRRGRAATTRTADAGDEHGGRDRAPGQTARACARSRAGDEPGGTRARHRCLCALTFQPQGAAGPEDPGTEQREQRGDEGDRDRRAPTRTDIAIAGPKARKNGDTAASNAAVPAATREPGSQDDRREGRDRAEHRLLARRPRPGRLSRRRCRRRCSR